MVETHEELPGPRVHGGNSKGAWRDRSEEPTGAWPRFNVSTKITED